MNVVDRPVYLVSLRPEPDCVDHIRALRWALKRLLRDHKLRCTGIREATGEIHHLGEGAHQ
jgi:hypothetical protein